MILGYDAKRAFCNFTGLGNYSRATISMLAERHPEARFQLYTPDFKPHREHSFADRENVRIIRPDGLGRRLPALWRSASLAGLAARDGVQIFHGLSGELPMGLSARRIRSVVTLHDLIFIRYPEFYSPIDRWIYRRKFAAACREADRIVAISDATRRDAIELLGADPQKIRLVYQGCHPQFYRPCSQEEKDRVAGKYRLPACFVLSVGTIESRKNLATLVRALPLLPKEVCLVGLGKPTPYFEQVEREIDRLGVAERVRIIPRSDFTDLPAIYQLARVFAMPSLFEGFGIPILEALNSGTPVVAARSSSLPEAGGPGSIYVDPMAEEEYAAAIGRLLDDPDHRARVVADGRAHALRFREEAIAPELWRVYTELAA